MEISELVDVGSEVGSKVKIVSWGCREEYSRYRSRRRAVKLESETGNPCYRPCILEAWVCGEVGVGKYALLEKLASVENATELGQGRYLELPVLHCQQETGGTRGTGASD